MKNPDAKVFNFFFYKDGNVVFKYLGRIGTESKVRRFAHSCMAEKPWDELIIQEVK